MMTSVYGDALASTGERSNKQMRMAAVQRMGRGISSIRHASEYICRGRL